MHTLDLPIQLGGTFTFKGRLKDKQTEAYVSFAGATLSFRALDEKGAAIAVLDADSGAGIELSDSNTRFTVTVADENTVQAKFKQADYNLVVTWADGTVQGILRGKLFPERLIV